MSNPRYTYKLLEDKANSFTRMQFECKRLQAQIDLFTNRLYTLIDQPPREKDGVHLRVLSELISFHRDKALAALGEFINTCEDLEVVDIEEIENE